MPDQDEFDPMGRDWRRAYDLCVSGGDLDEAGDEVLRAVTRMIRRGGGCPSFPDIDALLKQYWSTLQVSEKPEVNSSAERELNIGLDRIWKQFADNRIDVVAVRTARRMGHEMAVGVFVPERPTIIAVCLGREIVQHLICHRALDAARAHSIGITFRSSEAAHAYHNNLLSRISEQIQKIGVQLAADPTGKSVKRLRVLPPSDTSTILFDEKRFRLDFGDDLSSEM